MMKCRDMLNQLMSSQQKIKYDSGFKIEAVAFSKTTNECTAARKLKITGRMKKKTKLSTQHSQDKKCYERKTIQWSELFE